MEDLTEGMVGNFEMPDEIEKSEIIKIIGVGGAGSNAVNNMCGLGIEGVNLVVCNTDIQALDHSPVKCKIQLGQKLTGGLGAGNDPQCGRDSAIESMADIEAVLKDNTKMVFIAAGMGGGTGTGAAPVIAKAAKDMGIVTVGIVNIPYSREGKPRLRQAIKGAQEMSQCVDSLLVVNTDRVIEMYRSQDLPLAETFRKSDQVMSDAARCLAEMITKHDTVNTDFADAKKALTNSGCSLMGLAEVSGKGRAMEAVKQALDSPLLNNNDINGARFVLVNMRANPASPVTTSEYGDIMDYIYKSYGGDNNDHGQVIPGVGDDENLPEGAIQVIIVATGFASDCFEVNKSKETSAVHIPVGRPIDSAAGKAEEEEEKSRVVNFEAPEDVEADKIIADIYKHDGGKPGCKPGNYSTADLRDATALPFEKLTEEELANIEQTPAYLRRAGEK